MIYNVFKTEIEKAIDNYCKNSNSQKIEKWIKEVGLW